MNTRKLTFLTVAIVVLISVLGVCPVAHAQGTWTITQLTDNTTDDMWPAISGANVVWQGWDGSDWEIYSNYGQLTDNDVKDTRPDISGENVVWQQDYKMGNQMTYHIMSTFDGDLSYPRYSMPFHYTPKISGENVVWISSWYYDGYNNNYNVFSNFPDPDGQLSFNKVNQIWALAISGNIAVWIEQPASGPRIINSNILDPIYTVMGESPDIDGTYIVWAAIDPIGQVSDFEIYSNFSGQLTYDFIPDKNPRVSGMNVVWQHGDGDAVEISTNFGGQVTNNSSADLYPDISGTTVVWQGWDGTDWEIYMATYSTNAPPVAVGKEAVVAVGEVPNVDGGSYDPDDGDTIELSQSPGGAFDEAGIYHVELTVTDSHGATDSCTVMVVVYDPSAGFVTGGGWIDSPAGAYVPDPSLAGKANFGFVSKYKKGASVPTGQTEFVFQAGNLNFHSSSYDWLVVTGSNYARFKGTGAINGAGAYKFMLWAGDGPDTFRIRIWTEDDDGTETDIYDNGFDQDIGGGSIVIHTN
jgi:beta propeller repeat protein